MTRNMIPIDVTTVRTPDVESSVSSSVERT